MTMDAPSRSKTPNRDDAEDVNHSTHHKGTDADEPSDMDHDSDQEEEDDGGGNSNGRFRGPSDSTSAGVGNTLSIKLSETLHRKLMQTAREEGVSVDEFAGELLAEGVVLRAWEIIERKNTMRSGGNQPGPQQHQNGNMRHGNHGNNKNGNHQKPGSGGGGGGRHTNAKHRNHQNSLNLMEDKAAFLEYVRNQEKRRR